MTDHIKKPDSRSSEIRLNISLDAKNVPERLEWMASDAPDAKLQECQAFLLSIWDRKESNALRIDLWTKEMRVDEMNKLVFQMLASLSDTYLRATNNKKGAEDIRQFAMAFGKKADVLK